ncbi:MAG: tyrosine-type recombinase/integrase [Holophaga sp.]|nr:tyrosine-type recombinase/integrase [Holophaga sp.]
MPGKTRSNVKLTDTRVHEFKATGTQYRVWDSLIPGFHVLVQPSGSGSFRVQFQRSGGSKVSVSIGDVNAWNVKEAREKAAALRKMHEEGRDPQAFMKEERSGKTLEMLVDLWREDYAPRLKASTRHSYESLLRNVIVPSLGKRLVKDLSLTDVKSLYRETRKSTPVQANRAMAVLSKLLTIAEAEQWRTTGINPCHQLEREDEKPKTRVLTAAELAALESALTGLVTEGKLDAAHADLFRFLALSGLRRGEALRLKWKDIDLERSTMTFEEHKTDSEGTKVLPLNSHLLRILGERGKMRLSIFVFPGASPDRPFNGVGKILDRVRIRAKLLDITPHDLRRTFCTVCNELGYPASIGDALLGHSLGRIRDTYTQFGSNGILGLASQDVGDWIGAALAGKMPRAGVKAKGGKKGKDAIA